MIDISVPSPSRQAISNGVLGMLIALVTELMFFAGLISAYIVNRAGVLDWPPSDQPRLPILITAFNTVLLLLSAITLYKSKIKLKANSNPSKLILITMILGAVFVFIQGYEWIKLIGYGLTATSSIYGSFFYAIIGMHGFHALMGLSLLIYLYKIIKQSNSKENKIRKMNSCSLFWYFVVFIWPILYVLIYLV